MPNWIIAGTVGWPWGSRAGNAGMAYVIGYPSPAEVFDRFYRANKN